MTLEGNGEPVEYFLMRQITKIVSNLAEESNASSPDSGELARSPLGADRPRFEMTHARLPVEAKHHDRFSSREKKHAESQRTFLHPCSLIKRGHSSFGGRPLPPADVPA